MPIFKLGFNQSLKLFINKRIVSQIVKFSKIFIKKNESKLIKSIDDIPGPKPSLPIIGTGWQYNQFIGKYDIHKLHEVLYEKFQTYGPIFKEEYQRNKAIVYIYDPKDIETVFRNQGKCPIRPANDFVVHYRSRNTDKYSSVGIANMNGEEWYKQRQLIAPVLLKMDVITNYIPKLNIICKDFVEYIAKQMTCNTMSDDNVIDDFRDISYNFVLESISLWCLGTRLGCLDTQHNDSHSSVSIDKQMMTIATKELFESYQRLYYSSKLWKYVKTKPYRQLERSESCIYDTLSKYVDLAFSSKTGYESLMNELINLDTLSVNEIKVYLMDFIIGGLFTVSNALNFVCYHLANNPSIQQNLLREINAVTTDQNEITSQMLSQMPYLKACIKESFRLTSTVPGIVRVLPSDVILSGYHIPKGTPVFANYMTTCISDKYFSNPKSFIPERWIGDNRHDWPSFSVLPFGFGSRMCVGKRFAQLHIQMAVLYIIKHFEISVDESDEIELICNFLIIANRRIKLKVKRR